MHRNLDNFARQLEFVRFAISVLPESSSSQQCHAIFASDLRRLGEVLGRMSTTYAGIENLSWNREMRDSVQKCMQGLEPLLMLLPWDIRIALLKNFGLQKILQKLAVWASNEDELRRLQSEHVSCIKFITSRLDLMNRYILDRDAVEQ